MKIAVIAANGRLGQAFVENALEQGHKVKAGIRGMDPFDAHPHLETMQCDATNAKDLLELFKDQDAVVSCIGHVKGSTPDVQTKATKVLIRTMKQVDLRRFVTVTGTGVRLPGDHVGLVDRFLNLAVSIIDPHRVQDGKNHAALLQASDLDWTIIRVLKLQNTKPHSFDLKLHGPTKWYVGRKEVAKAMLKVLKNNSFVRHMPIISRK